MKYYLEKVEFT